MQRLIPLLTLLLCLPSFAAEKFNLGELMAQAQKYPAPAKLRVQLASVPINHNALLRCKADKQWGLENIESFFAAKPIILTAKRNPIFIVFPTTYCPEFFGAHAISFWVMEQLPDGSYKELFYDSSDFLVIHNKKTNGYKDLSTLYGFDTVRFVHFDGKEYH